MQKLSTSNVIFPIPLLRNHVTYFKMAVKIVSVSEPNDHAQSDHAMCLKRGNKIHAPV